MHRFQCLIACLLPFAAHLADGLLFLLLQYPGCESLYVSVPPASGYRHSSDDAQRQILSTAVYMLTPC